MTDTILVGHHPEKKCHYCRFAKHPDRPDKTVFCTKNKITLSTGCTCASFELREPPIASLVESPKPIVQNYLSPQQRRQAPGEGVRNMHRRCYTCTHSYCETPKTTTNGRRLQECFCKLQNNAKVHQSGICEHYKKIGFGIPFLRVDVVDGPGGAA